MIRMTIVADILKVFVPDELKDQAPELLNTIWRDEFRGLSQFGLELTEPILKFVTQAMGSSKILVCQ